MLTSHDERQDDHIGIRLPLHEREELDKYARANDLNRSQVVRRAIRLLLKQEKKGRRNEA